jgi:crotonobetainyl-CoA:carnitine CoA-transferase CaiB-like acyl-CoA transferase
LRSPAPTLGRDNDSVLEELGYSPAETQRLHEAGHVGAIPMGL